MRILDSGLLSLDSMVRVTNHDPALPEIRSPPSAMRDAGRGLRTAGRGVRIAEGKNHESESEWSTATGARAKTAASFNEPLVLGRHSPVNT